MPTVKTRQPGLFGDAQGSWKGCYRRLTDVEIEKLDYRRRPYSNGNELSESPATGIGKVDVVNDEDQLADVETDEQEQKEFNGGPI